MALEDSEQELLKQPTGNYPPSLDHLVHTLIHFNNECRAYRKLIENNLNGEVAVRCHRYLMLLAKRKMIWTNVSD